MSQVMWGTQRSGTHSRALYQLSYIGIPSLADSLDLLALSFPTRFV